MIPYRESNQRSLAFLPGATWPPVLDKCFVAFKTLSESCHIVTRGNTYTNGQKKGYTEYMSYSLINLKHSIFLT